MEIPLIRAFAEANQRKRRGLVILGDPGSGKTTHLKRLLLACLREGPAGMGLPSNTVPVFLPLRELDDLTHGIDTFIEKTLASPHLKMALGFGGRLLERGHLLLLFDGLDEVSDPKQRAKYRIPHYRLVGRVRFRLSELTAWSARSASTTAPRREVTP